MQNPGLKAKFPAQGISVKLLLLSFIEDNLHVVYSPALDLTGYGNDEGEARDSFQVSLSEYIRYTSNKKTLEKDLLKHGWKVDKKHRHISSPNFSELLQKLDELRDIINNRPFKKFDINIDMPAFAE